MKKLLIMILLGISISNLYAQENGNTFISNYSSRMYKADSQNFWSVQDKHGFMYFANGSGILEYDGITWRTIPFTNNGIVFALAIDASSKIYVAGDGDFGYLTTNNFGKTIFCSLLHLLNEKDRKMPAIRDISVLNNQVYFSNYYKVFKYSEGKIKIYALKNNNSAVAHINNQAYFFTYANEVFREENDTLIQINKGTKKFMLNGAVICPYLNNCIMATGNLSGLFIYKPVFTNDTVNTFQKFHSDLDTVKYRPYYTTLIENKRLALSAIGTGVFILDSLGKLQFNMNLNTGLQNKSIYHIFEDREKILWFAQNKDIANAQPSHPITAWNSNSGLTSSVWDIVRFNGILYIATNEGIFYLKNNALHKIKLDNANCTKFLVVNDKNNPSKQHLLAAYSIFFIEIYDENKIKYHAQRMPTIYSIYQSKTNSDIIFAGSINGLHKLELRKDKWTFTEKLAGFNVAVRAIAEDGKGNLWLTTNSDGIVKVTDYKDLTKASFKFYTTANGLGSQKNLRISVVNHQIFFNSEAGIYRYNAQTDRFEPDRSFGEQFGNGKNAVRLIVPLADGGFFICGSESKKSTVGILKPKEKGQFTCIDQAFRLLPEMFIINVYAEADGMVWIGGSEGLYKYNPKAEFNFNLPFNTYVRKVTFGKDSTVFYGTFYETKNNQNLAIDDQPDDLKPQVDYKLNSVKLEFAGLSFANEAENLYQFMLEGFDNDWADWSKITMKEYTNLKEGKYTFKVRCKNLYGVESNTATYEFTILSPWYRTWWAYALYFILFIIFIYFIIKYYTHHLIKQKEHLEQVVDERTAEIRHQKNEIEEKNEELQQQKEEILTQAEDLKTTNEKLIELSDFKEGMTGMIVHDLKNPLNSIINNDNIDRIKQAGKQMLTMVMNILDVQKFEDAKMHLVFQNSSAFDIAQNAYSQVEILIKEKNITFENHINPQLGIRTEPEILERVFINLLTNAIKYTPNNGRIIMNYELRIMNEKQIIHNSSFIILKVSDTGQGIAADNLHKVFEKFGQIQAKKSGGVRSTGLGLTFCKLAIEAHGGEIGVESEVNEGTTFWFTIPLGTERENTNFAEAKQIETETFALSDKDKQLLLPLLSQFKELEVYEVSSIRNLLKNIDISANPNLKRWIEEMQNIVRAGNEEMYAELLSRIEN